MEACFQGGGTSFGLFPWKQEGRQATFDPGEEPLTTPWKIPLTPRASAFRLLLHWAHDP